MFVNQTFRKILGTAVIVILFLTRTGDIAHTGTKAGKAAASAPAGRRPAAAVADRPWGNPAMRRPAALPAAFTALAATGAPS
ncbi:hypothetical protein [Streptomyces ipomoeae]|uniref:hypothetical protein n=1 Tax=Streptomyces ipomoeae TaxID=103232 RepID=UPI001146ACEF|nr:hypothetical protein [Streptomyces ipomoeae]MDX2936863.1 hypothetical protein [Streptomyces ipomoeae]TQE23885.1 hypothetical protein SipoB123_20390 [Streptomyces ipomoeae]